MVFGDLPVIKYLTKNSRFSYLVLTILVFVAGCFISLINWRHAETRANDNLISKYKLQLDQSKSIITEGLNQYSLLLDDGASLLTSYNDNITQSQWLNFFKTYDFASNYPGVDAVSFSQYVRSNNISSYLSNLANQGEAKFQITPAGSRSVYAPITYIGYVSPVSLNAMGYDELSNPIRSAAINRALNSGQVAMTGKISLIAVNKGQPAFTIFKPVYDGLASTPAERQSSIYGFVFTAINAQQFFSGLLGHYIEPGIAIQVYDSSNRASNLLYESPDYSTRVKHIVAPVYSKLNINFGGRTWVANVVISKAILQSGSSQSYDADLLVGISISALLALVVWYFTYYQLRKIYWQQQQELAMAKDELLSLASHQLRTPATIVKQYLGILLQNYSAPITEEHRRIIQTAYDSNEHQLEIANQFLEAARLGSGRIELHKEELEISELVQGVITDQQKIARSRQQRIIYNKPKRPYRIIGDPKYLPMVFENLINNAINYSKRRSKIAVSLRRSGNEVIVSVSDQGIGIAPEELALIFEKFVHSSTTEDVGGAGIGLYLVKQITSLHGGNVSVKSTVGKGSTFSVRLPIKPL